MNIDDFIPRRINSGPFLVGYSRNALRERISGQRIVLPICSLGTPAAELARLGPLVLPPLYHEALDEPLKQAILERIAFCFPYLHGTRERAAFPGQLDVVELPRRPIPWVSQENGDLNPDTVPGGDSKANRSGAGRVVAFSVDTAVEEHGPHLPLATDTIQSYGVLARLVREMPHIVLAPPLEYGQLTWGLPFGLSVDITAPLLTRYVTGYANALQDWIRPDATYVVDVHGSIVHRSAIRAGLAASRCGRWAFRWLHEPLVEFAGERGDQHAGGVETALVHFIDPQLVDAHWWPARIEELAARQMPMSLAIELSSNLDRFVEQVETQAFNGIVGDVRNFFQVDPNEMMNRMLVVARSDLRELTLPN